MKKKTTAIEQPKPTPAHTAPESWYLILDVTNRDIDGLIANYAFACNRERISTEEWNRCNSRLSYWMMVRDCWSKHGATHDTFKGSKTYYQ